MAASLAVAAIAAGCVAPGFAGGGAAAAAVAGAPPGPVPVTAAAVDRDEIAVTVPAPVERVTPRVVALFLENGIAVTSAMGGVVEAKLPREYQWVGRYEITARAYVMPGGTAGTTSIRLAAEERRESIALGEATRPVNRHARGRALRVWQGFERVAVALAADSSAAAATSTQSRGEH